MSFTESSVRQMKFVNQHTAAKMIGVDVRTLRRWHRQGIGPTRRNIEHRRPILYSRVEVEQFAATYNSAIAVQTPANGHSEADHVQTPANGQSSHCLVQIPANGHFEIGLCNGLQTDIRD